MPTGEDGNCPTKGKKYNRVCKEVFCCKNVKCLATMKEHHKCKACYSIVEHFKYSAVVSCIGSCPIHSMMFGNKADIHVKDFMAMRTATYFKNTTLAIFFFMPMKGIVQCQSTRSIESMELSFEQ